jgi:hypothetical protein
MLQSLLEAFCQSNLVFIIKLNDDAIESSCKYLCMFKTQILRKFHQII